MSDVFFIGKLRTSTQPNIKSLVGLTQLQVSGVSTLASINCNSINIVPIKIGRNAGFTNQQTNAIAIGISAGQASQGTNCIAIGQNAGQTNQNQFTTVINASGTVLNTTTNSALYMHPIRNQASSTTSYIPLSYNTTSKEVISSTDLNLFGNFSVKTNVIIVDSVNNRVGINQASPSVSFQSTGTTHQLGTMIISNNATFTETAIRAQIYLDDINRRITFQNNGNNNYILYNEGWLALGTLSSSHPSALNGLYGFTGNNLYFGANSGTFVFRNTSSNTDLVTIGTSGNIAIPTNSAVHATLNSNEHFGYATAQTTGTGSSLFGPFRRTSQNYTQISNGSSNYSFTFNDGVTDPNALFYPSSVDNCGGILNIYLKKIHSSDLFSYGAGILNVFITKRVGIDLSNTASFTLASSYSQGLTSIPTLGGGTGNVLRMNFNTTDTTSPNSMYVCWEFDGFI